MTLLAVMDSCLPYGPAVEKGCEEIKDDCSWHGEVNVGVGISSGGMYIF